LQEVIEMAVTPQKTDIDDKTAISQMFDSIAWRYDFLNHFLSIGIDRLWRRRVIGIISKSHKNPYILDVATGTCDLAIAAIELNPSKIIGIDISEKMLELGRKKIERKGLSEIIQVIKCDSENICFEDNRFDVAMVAFGVRNFTDPLKGLSEMSRVIHEDGLLVVLEFSRPTGFLFKNVYNFYFRNLLPSIGKVFSKDRLAYRYLNESVMRFPDNEEFMILMKNAGLSDLQQVKLSGGIASIYAGIKKQIQ
jgi:demethylmenaquinone methyltransferase/2-methoxy-6-polyprenyl-1,4-benzoquinol methylase